MAIPYSSITKIPDTEPEAVPELWNDTYEEIDSNFADLETRMANKETGGSLPSSVVLSSGSDLNDCQTAGLYYLLGGANEYINAPQGAANGGFLIVYKGNTSAAPVMQSFYQLNGKAMYIRRYTSSWTEWEKTADSTASSYAEDGKTRHQTGDAPYEADETPDLDSYISSGVFLFAATKAAVTNNFPEEGRLTWLWVSSPSTSQYITVQMAFCPVSGGFWQRYYTTEWSAWVQISDNTIFSQTRNAISTGQIECAKILAPTVALDVDTLTEHGIYYLARKNGSVSCVYNNLPDLVVNGWLYVIQTKNKTNGPIYQILYSTNGMTVFSRRKLTVATSEMNYQDILEWSPWQVVGGVSRACAADLNDYLRQGQYYLSYYVLDSDDVSEAGLVQVSYLNAPTGFTNGFLSVLKSGNSYNGNTVTQELSSADGRTVWRRQGVMSANAGYVYHGSVSWSAWEVFASVGIVSEVNNALSAGQIKNAVYTSGTVDVDTYTTTGCWFIASSATLVNAPPGITYGFLSVQHVSSSGPIIQYFRQPGGSAYSCIVYVRSRVSGTASWSAWARIDGARPTTSEGPGQWVALNVSDHTELKLPDGGTWAYFTQRYAADGTISTAVTGVAAGGSTILSSSSIYQARGFAWRVA